MDARNTGLTKSMLPLKSVFYWKIPSAFRLPEECSDICKKGGFWGHDSTWHTHNYYSVQRSKHLYTSDLFKMTENSKISWMIRLGFNTYYMFLYLVLLSADIQPVLAKYKIYILKDKREIYVKSGKDSFFVAADKETGFKEAKGFGRFINKHELFALLSESSNREEEFYLHLRCEMKVKNSVPDFGEFVTISPRNLLKDVENLMQEKDFSDFTLCVKGQEFYVHKAILAQRSSVFKTMFQCDMKEKMQNKVSVDDIDPEVFQIVIKYIYTDSIDIEASLSSALLYAAEKYNLVRLKSACEKCIAENLNDKNAVDVLFLADAHNSDSLRKAALDCITRYPKQVYNTESWNTMLQTRFDLTKECLNVIFDHLKLE